MRPSKLPRATRKTDPAYQQSTIVPLPKEEVEVYRFVFAAFWPNITFLASALMVCPRFGLTSGPRA